ncbi:hypothetical protein Leryth_025540 [Lithospermum erythrorhizon]|nr:hypothetical protein Leryth_025540 [Lithospermum erythrorhizon]
MRRGKSVMPSLIQDKKKRIQTFQKKRKGLEKKAYELSTLCDVNICMIMFAPDDPIIWPEDPNLTHRMISFYQDEKKGDKNRRKHVDIAIEKLKKLEIEDKYPIWDESYDSFSYDKLLMVGNELDNILLKVKSRIDSMKTQQMFQAVSSYNPLHALNSFNCLGNEADLALHNSQSVNITDESLNCFGNEGAVGCSSSQTVNIMDECFNCFGNERALLLHNSQTMEMDQSSSCSNFHNYNNNIVPVPFDNTTANTSHDLPPFPGFEENFVQNNNNLIMDQLQSQYLCYAPSQSQKLAFMPVPSPSIDAYSLMMHAEISDPKIDEFGFWRQLLLFIDN